MDRRGRLRDAVDGVAAGREGIGGNAGLTLAVVSCRAAANRPGETSPMWQSTAMIAAAASAGLLAVVLAYLAAADRTCPAWRLWSASFAIDAARSLALVGHPDIGSASCGERVCPHV